MTLENRKKTIVWIVALVVAALVLQVMIGPSRRSDFRSVIDRAWPRTWGGR